MSRNTLSDKKEIVRIFRHGRRQRGALFTLIVCKNTKKKNFFVVSIAKKALSHATDRNIIRRRAQNVLMDVDFSKDSGYSYIAQFNAKEVKPYQEIRTDLIHLLGYIK